MNFTKLAAAVVLAGVAAFAGGGRAAAQQASTTTAYLGGLETGKAAVPTLVAFNTTSSSMTLDLTLRGPDGTALVTLPGAVSLDPRATVQRDLRLDLAHAGANGKAYVGIFTAELSGTDPYTQDSVVVHATQYFGSRNKPRAAFVVRPLFILVP